MKRKHKLYSKPKRPFDKVRINEEIEIKKEFGLKNKREIWKAEAKIKSMREKAKKMISADKEKQEKFFDKLKKIGLEINSIGDILALDKKDYLKRRLQSVLVEKKIAKTPREARQLIVHKKVLVEGKVVNIPSYVVPIEVENKITLKKPKAKKTEKKTADKENPKEENKEEDKK